MTLTFGGEASDDTPAERNEFLSGGDESGGPAQAVGEVALTDGDGTKVSALADKDGTALFDRTGMKGAAQAERDVETISRCGIHDASQGSSLHVSLPNSLDLVDKSVGFDITFSLITFLETGAVTRDGTGAGTFILDGGRIGGGTITEGTATVDKYCRLPNPYGNNNFVYSNTSLAGASVRRT